MKLIVSGLLLVLSAVPASADKCDPLTPTNAQNIDEGFKGKIDGEIKGFLGRIAGGAAAIEGEYRKLETDQLKDYPASDKLYVWQRIIYLACVNPDSKIDINELLKIFLSVPSKTASLCPPGTQPAAHQAVGIENDHSAVGEEYSDSAHGIYNYCSVVGKETPSSTSHSESGDEPVIYRVPKTDPSGNPCQRFVLKVVADSNVVVGPPGFNPFGLPPGSCLAEQIVTNNWGGTVTNEGVRVTRQTSSGNHPDMK